MTISTDPRPLDEGEGRGPRRDGRVRAEDPQRLFFNRELSQIEFYRRVLEEALDPTQPLLERLKFLSIFSTNLDEFFMIRVSGLKEMLEGEVSELSPDGADQAWQLREIRERLVPLFEEQSDCLLGELLPALAAEGIEIVSHRSLNQDERRAAREHFVKQVLPLLTPQGVDSGHPFPYISGLSLNLGLTIEPLPELGITRSLTGKVEPRFVRLKVPPLVKRLVPVGGGKSRFVLVEELTSRSARTRPTTSCGPSSSPCANGASARPCGSKSPPACRTRWSRT
jgi:polyphosphate kinase